MNDIFVAPKKNIHPSHAHLFSTFCENPLDVWFKDQKPDEKILLFLRRHFITNLPWIATSIVLLFLPLLFPLIRPFLNLNLPFASVSLMIILFIFYYLIVFSYVLTQFMHWFYNIFIVTQERIIDIDYSHIVIHNMATTKLSHIQDVSYTQGGFIRSLFNFGDLFAQTAGTESNFEALAIPKPRKATKIIGDLIGKKVV